MVFFFTCVMFRQAFLFLSSFVFECALIVYIVMYLDSSAVDLTTVMYNNDE